MSTKKKMLWLLSLLPFFIACGDDNTDIPDWPWAEPETPTEPVEANPDIVNLGWTNVKSTYGTLPEHINVYKSPSPLYAAPSKTRKKKMQRNLSSTGDERFSESSILFLSFSSYKL